MIKRYTLQKFSSYFLVFSVLCLHNAFAQNVGIGTSDPQNKLHVASGANPWDIQTRVDGRIWSKSANPGIWFGDNLTDKAGFIGINPGSNPAIKTFTGIYTVPLNSWALNIDNSNGFVGIGQIEPTERFHLHSNTTGAQVLGRFSTATAVGTTFGFANTGLNFYMNNTDGGGFQWWTSGTERMRLTGTGNLGIGVASPAASLDVAGRTLKLSNTYPRYRWFFGGAQDTSWKKIADVTIATGSYRAVTFEVVVMDAFTNYGHSADARKMTFYVSMRRSGANPDDLNDAIVKGPSTNYVRAVKTATGVYELQVRQTTDWRHMTVEAQVISELGATVTYIDNPANGSTSGTIYTSTGSIFYDGYWTRSGTSLYNTYQSDNVGIGTTTPGATLNVVHPVANTTPTKPSGNWAAIIENNQDAIDSRHGLSVVTRWGSSESKIFEAASYWNGSTQIYTPVLTVLGNRRVGIGTTSPANLLEVKGGHSDSQIRLFSDHYAQGINGANTAVMTLWASEPGVTWTGVGIGNNIYNTTNFPRLTTTRGGSYLRLLENQVNINVVNSLGTDIQAFAVLPGWEAGNGSIKIGNNHTINSHSNTWLYIGDQNKNVFGGTGLATGRIYTVNAQVIDLGGSGNVFVMADNNGTLYKSSTSPYANMPQGTMVGLCIQNTSSGCCNCNAGVKAPITGWGTCPAGYSWQQIAARWNGLNERWVYTCIKD